MKQELTKEQTDQILSISTHEHFNAEYKQCKTFGDWDRLMDRMSNQLIREIHSALQVVVATTGGTMREESFCKVLGYRINDADLPTVNKVNHDDGTSTVVHNDGSMIGVRQDDNRKVKIRITSTGKLHLSGGLSAAHCSAGNKGMHFEGRVHARHACSFPPDRFCKKCFGKVPYRTLQNMINNDSIE